MGLDIRIPLGLMFLITGGLMAVYGILTHGSVIYARSLGVNLNLGWGLVMFVFGLLMFWLGRRPQRRPTKTTAEPDEPLPRGH